MRFFATPSSRRRRGAMLLAAAMLLPVFLLLAGFTLEISNHSMHRHRIQMATDAAAKAATFEVAKGPAHVQSLVEQVLADNGVSNATEGVESITIEYGYWSPTLDQFVALGSGATVREANAVRVHVRADIPTVMVDALGHKRITAESEAIAMRPGVVLAVKNVSKTRSNDAAMLSYLDSLNVPIRIIDQSQLDADCISEGEVLFISSSVSSGKVDHAVVNVPGPVLVGEVMLYDTFGFTGGVDKEDHGDKIYENQIDVEIDLRSMKTNGQWRAEWLQWWNNDGRHKTNADRVAAYYAGTWSFSTRVAYTPTVTTSNRRTGWADRWKLGNDAVVLSTIPGDVYKATTFWFDVGSTLGDGSVTQHKRAGVYIRTGDNEGGGWSYNNSGFEELGHTIRWMLSDYDGQTKLVH